MNLNRIFKIILFTACLFILTGLQPSGRAETHSFPGPAAQDSPREIIPFHQQQEKTRDEDPDRDIPRGRAAAVSVSTNLVTLQALVTDEKGNVITGLKPGNFTVYEDKVEQEIQNFAPIEANITAVMLVEQTKRSSYSLDQVFIDQIYNIMNTFVRKLQRGDWVGVIGYDIKPTILCDFTQDHQKILDTMRTFRFPAIRENNLFDALIDTLDRT
jgi:hypothetical protein